MMSERREEQALRKLLTIAKRGADDLGAHIASLEAARASAGASLDWIVEAERAERGALDENDPVKLVDLARYLEGAAAKRKALEATRAMLSKEIEAARERLSEALVETKKLEHLLEIGRKAAAKRRGKNDLAALDAAARLRARA